MKVSGAVAMADHVEAFGLVEYGGKVGGSMADCKPIPFDADPFTPGFNDFYMGWNEKTGKWDFYKRAP